MKNIKQVLQLITILFLFTAASCDEQYADLEDGIYAEFVTNRGVMLARLFYEEMPITVANFVALAEGNHPKVKEEFKGKKYYEGTTFHRVIDRFMIQGGDPTGTGSGGPGYQFDDEFSVNLKHDKPGILSMANSGPNTNGSQFFITERATPHLDAITPNETIKQCGAFRGGSCHAVFGELILGLDIQDSISNVKTKADKPIKKVIIEKLNIIRKGKKAKQFDAPKIFSEESPKLAEKMEALKETLTKKWDEKLSQIKEDFVKFNDSITVDAIQSDSGMKMVYLYRGGGEKPGSDQKVLIDYAGYFADGKLFGTTYERLAKTYGIYDAKERYKPFPMNYNEQAKLIDGFREAMLKMSLGDKARIFVPAHIGYGEKGSGPIPPNTDLVFDIELSGVEE